MAMRRTLVPIAALASAAAVATAALAQGTQVAKSGAAAASAAAYARDNGDGARPSHYVTSSGTASHASRGTSATTSTAHGNASATGRARVDQVSIFNSLVTADTATVTASADGRSATASGGEIINLVVGGSSKGSPKRAATYDMQGYGTLDVLQQSGTGITAMRAKLTRPYGRFPKGTVVRVAYARASARDGADPNPPPPPPKRPPPPKPHRTPKPHKTATKPPPSAHPTKPAKPKRRKPSRTHVLLTGKGFVFPVYGPHNYTDTFGAPRADTGMHEGNDIFADAGTPLVAVCDGSLNRVGTLPISGNRLWVKCSKTGDSFFYAHLSAYATDTRSGEKVTAGQVIGFLGSTGDAEQTPPHLHFEVHPGDGAAVDPYPFLRAWESHRDVPAAAWVRTNGQPGQQPGTLVVLRDFLSSR
jgi:murein DD-endopeptidase MepM/ murein hydrolase activator NlpD